MNEDEKDQGEVLVLLDRLIKQRLPIALAMKKKVDSGVLLTDGDHQIIYEVQENAIKFRPIIDRHPEYKELAAKVLNLWVEIINKDIANQNITK